MERELATLGAAMKAEGRLLDEWLELARSTATAEASLLPDVAG